MAHESEDTASRPFISSELRPVMDDAKNETHSLQGPNATSDEVGNAAREVLSESEQHSLKQGAGLSLSELAKTKAIRNPDVHCSNLEDESILLNLETGMYYTLNRVGTVMWDLLASEKTLDTILSDICHRFEVSQDVAHKDLSNLVMKMKEEGMIQTQTV